MDEEQHKAIEKEELKKQLNAAGVPVGVGMPENPIHGWTDEDGLPVDKNGNPIPTQEEEGFLHAMATEERDPNFARQPAPTDIGQLIQWLNSLTPWKVAPVLDEDGKIIDIQVVDGDIPQEMLIDFWGFLSHPNSLSNYTRHDFEMTMCDLEIAMMSKMMSRSRDNYTPQRMNWEDNVHHLIRAKNLQSVGGFERIMSTTQRMEEERGLRIGRQPGRWDTLKDRARGRMVE